MEEANGQTRIIERDLAKLSERFDRHLEIYAQNGKELYGLKSSVESLRNTIERQEIREKDIHDNLWTQTKQNSSDISTINVALSNLTLKVSMIAASASTIASFAGSIAMNALFGA